MVFHPRGKQCGAVFCDENVAFLRVAQEGPLRFSVLFTLLWGSCEEKTVLVVVHYQ